MTVITRFAPSPTGYLHVGGARTALYSWLHAQKNNGEFILRIEDTDRERSTDEAVQAILDGMEWLGLAHTQGPFYQTKRFDRYKEATLQMLEEGTAYRCYCSKERLEALREEQMANKQKPRYDGTCRHLTKEQQQLDKPFVVRFKNPEDGDVVWQDAVKGEIRIANKELDDLIIARTDGTPTYNFTVVIDDWDMKITQVIRGDDHVNNTPRQINIFEALNAPVPEYAHVAMILGDDGKKLSKRHGAVSVMQYRDEGFFKQALLNYLVRLGWSHGDQEIFSLEEMKSLFDIHDINKAASAFNTDKLRWLNQHYLKTLPVEQVLQELEWHLQDQKLDISQGPVVAELIPLFSERVHTLKELVTAIRYFYEDFSEFDEAAAKKHLRPVAKEAMQVVMNKLANVNDWSAVNIQAAIDATVEELNIGMGKVGMPLRVAVTGAGQSPNLDLTLFYIGKDKVLSRVQKAIDFISEREQSV